METANPTIGLAFSGGGYRAMLAGAGELLALDSRATNPSVLSGILQSSNYIAGLSGGSWLVGSLASNDLIPVDQLLREDKLWDIQNSLVAYYGVNIVRNTAMWVTLICRSKPNN